jgi:eukaryotic-like serine/threonine-protein kinase
MSHDNVLTPWPEDWQQRREEILDQLLQRWERAWEQGEDLSPQHLCPDGPEELRRELAEGIACLKAFDQQFRPDATPQTLEAQQFRAGDYEGLDDIEEGGQGKVIRAQDRYLGRTVAIKLLQDHWAWSASARRRLEQEAQITGNLEHPGIIPVYGFGYDAAGNPYYAMRYVQGERTLHDAIDHVHNLPDTPERSVAVQKLVRDFLMVCRTVDYAHSRNVIHRDLKPANIMVGDYGEVFVMDWGLAKPLPAADSETGPMAPESTAPRMGPSPAHTVGAMGTWHYIPTTVAV